MECLGPQCATMLLEWLRARSAKEDQDGSRQSGADPLRQGLLWNAVAYSEESPVITTESELVGALEHLRYAVFRRFENQLTRAERTRLDNSIENAALQDRSLSRSHHRRPAPCSGNRRPAQPDPCRARTVRADAHPGASGRAKACATVVAVCRELRGVCCRTVRGSGLRGRADRRHRR